MKPKNSDYQKEQLEEMREYQRELKRNMMYELGHDYVKENAWHDIVKLNEESNDA